MFLGNVSFCHVRLSKGALEKRGEKMGEDGLVRYDTCGLGRGRWVDGRHCTVESRPGAW